MATRRDPDSTAMGSIAIQVRRGAEVLGYDPEHLTGQQRPAEEMTPAQYQELAARYNGGPYGQTDDAQDYGRGFANNPDEARNALR